MELKDLSELDVIHRVIHLRKLKGISQENMSELLSMPKRTYQRVESGEKSITINLLYLMSQVLEVEPRFLMTGIFVTGELGEGISFVEDLDSINDFVEILYEMHKASLDPMMKKNFLCSETSLVKSTLSDSFLELGISKEKVIDLSSVFNSLESLVFDWQKILKNSHDCRYFILNQRVDFGGNDVHLLSLVLLVRAIKSDPLVLEYHHPVPLHQDFSIDTLGEIAEKLSSKINEKVICLNTIR
jgi:transcriptional regulator with XRE-family HTH domain